MSCFSSSSSSSFFSRPVCPRQLSMANSTSNPFHDAHAVSNIKTHIPISLDSKGSPNYEKWSSCFNTTVDRLSLTDLLNGKPCPPNISIEDWQRADSLLQYWIYSTISEDLSSMIFSKTASAHDLWTSLASLFIKSVMLGGSLSIYGYCRAIKAAADNLASAGKPLPDEQLVLQTLRGLPEQFEAFADFISCQDPLPRFAEIDHLIRWEEDRLNDKIFLELNDEQGKELNENSTDEINESCGTLGLYVDQRQARRDEYTNPRFDFIEEALEKVFLYFHRRNQSY